MRHPTTSRTLRPGSLSPQVAATPASDTTSSDASPSTTNGDVLPAPAFKKKLLSGDIRAKCDLALFLNMFPAPSKSKPSTLPPPLETRQAEVVKRAGITFENDVFWDIHAAFGDAVAAAPSFHDASATKTRENLKTFKDVDLRIELRKPTPPLAVVQAEVNMENGPSIRFYDAMGAARQPRPTMGSFKPDIIFVRPRVDGQRIVLPDARRVAMDAADARLVIGIADVKHASEPNPSYEAEVVLYAVMIANWLHAEGLAGRYVVDAEPRLWTRGALPEGTLEEIAAMSPAQGLLRLELSLEKVNVGVHAQELRRFVAERMPAILTKGTNEGWRSLGWHVSAACSGCEWLGNEDWLSPEQKSVYQNHPGNYCFKRAKENGHLSRIPGITRGAAKALAKHGVDDLEKLSHLPPDAAAWRSHTSLTAMRRTLPLLASALRDQYSKTDGERVDGTLPAYADLTLNLFVENDAGSGVLAGVGLSSATFVGEPKPSLHSEGFVSDRKTMDGERAMVVALLSRIGDLLERALKEARPKHGSPTASVVFWRRSHYDDLSNAIGRHMGAVVAEGREAMTALAWLFPASSLQARGAELRHPPVSFLADSVRRLVHTPVPHALTLADVAANYNHTQDRKPLPHPFYVDPFSDKIPRERIYEIWEMEEEDTKDLRVRMLLDNGKEARDPSGNPVMRIRTVTRAEFKTMFEAALSKRAGLISSIALRLRRDMRGRLLARAAPIKLVPPTWREGVAFDAKLWIGRAEFAFAHDQQRTLLRYMSEPEEVEASNEGLRLERLLSTDVDGTMTFEVAAGALASKMKSPDANVVLVPEGVAGIAAMTTSTLLSKLGEEVEEDLKAAARAPMHSVFSASLKEFDRASGTAKVRFDGGPKSKKARLRSLVLAALDTDMSGRACVFGGLPPDITNRRLVAVLDALGNPPVADADPATVKAIGATHAPPPGTSPIRPAALVLWRAGELASTRVASPEEVERIVQTSRSRGLDASQQAAVATCSERALSIVWGPPGTGKTNTLTGFLHGLAALHGRRGTARNILVSGPTYKAVGELAQRMIATLSEDTSFPATIALVGAREMATVKDIPSHLKVVVTEADEGPDFTALAERLHDRPGVTVVCAITHQCARLATKAPKVASGHWSGVLHGMFDTVVIDESSQVDMTTAVFPLALLREGGQVIVAGDHLQMPPVQTVEPPTGAEHMVGSIQAYLIERFKVTPASLEVNYRSNAEIVGYCRGLGYPAGLRAAFPRTRLSRFSRNSTPARVEALNHAIGSRLNQSGLPWSKAFEEVLAPERGLCAITYADGISGQTNAFEASVVASVALALRGSFSKGLDGYREGSGSDEEWDPKGFFTKGIGVVTPHRAQRAGVVAALIQAFPDAPPELVEDAVDTVERFQGGERHTVLVSFGVGDPDVIAGEERFLMGLERTNVAVSRAMAKCIVLMSRELTSHIPVDRAASRGAHAIRGIVDDWCDGRLTAPVSGGPEDGRAVTAHWRTSSVT